MIEGMRNRFKIGNKVIGNKNTPTVVGRRSGTIKYIYNDWMAVEFDTAFPCGHDCSGVCKKGHGWNVRFNEVDLILSDWDE